MPVHCAELKRVLSVSDAVLQKNSRIFNRFSISPTIVSGMGYTGTEAQLRSGESLPQSHAHHVSSPNSPSAPPYLPATVLSIGLSFLGDRIKWRGPLVLMIIPLAMTGESLHLERCILAYNKLGYLILVVAHVRHP